MLYTTKTGNRRKKAPLFHKLTKQLKKTLKKITPIIARGNRDLKMTFEDQLNALIYFHLEEHSSERHFVQVLKDL